VFTRATVQVVSGDARRRWTPLAVGAAALAVAFLLLALAIRSTRDRVSGRGGTRA
jgi:hypothetical protein